MDSLANLSGGYDRCLLHLVRQETPGRCQEDVHEVAESSLTIRWLGRFVKAMQRAALMAAQILASIYCSRLGRGEQ